MTIYDSLLNRVERLAKHIGRTDEIVAGLQQQEYDLRHARDGAVRELQQVKADRDETEAKRKMLHQAVNQMFAELSAAAATFWPDHEPGTVAIPKLTGEIARLRAEIETLRKQLANSQRELSEQGLVHGVELQRETADLRKQLADAQREASEEFAERQVLTAEQQEGEAAWQQQLDAAQAEATKLRTLNDALLEKDKRLRSDHARLGHLVEERGQELERLLAFVKVMRGLLTEEYADQRIIAEALAELDAGTIQPAPCSECERWQRETERLNTEFVLSTAEVIELRGHLVKLRVFVGRVQSVVDGVTPATSKLCRICDALDELDAGTAEPAPVAEPAP